MATNVPMLSAVTPPQPCDGVTPSRTRTRAPTPIAGSLGGFGNVAVAPLAPRSPPLEDQLA